MFPPKSSGIIPIFLSRVRRSLWSRGYTTASQHTIPVSENPPLQGDSLLAARIPKREGTIEDVFSFTAEAAPLPHRFSDLKKEIFHLQLVKSWAEVLAELKIVTERVASEGAKVIHSCCCLSL